MGFGRSPLFPHWGSVLLLRFWRFPHDPTRAAVLDAGQVRAIAPLFRRMKASADRGIGRQLRHSSSGDHPLFPALNHRRLAVRYSCFGVLARSPVSVRRQPVTRSVAQRPARRQRGSGDRPPFRRCPTRQRAVPARCFLAARASKWRRGLGRSPPFSLLRDRRFRCLERLADSGGKPGRFACA